MNPDRDDALTRWFADQSQPNAAADFTRQLAPRLRREKTHRHWKRALVALSVLLAVGLLVPAIEMVTLLAADAVLQVAEISLAVADKD